jgi:hypothetical protein
MRDRCTLRGFVAFGAVLFSGCLGGGDDNDHEGARVEEDGIGAVSGGGKWRTSAENVSVDVT